jgi:hypothetical protein
MALRETPPAQTRPTTYDVTVCASPSGEINVRHEIEVLKPALLYGDTATLISPAVATFRLMASTDSLSMRDGAEMAMKFFEDRDPEAATEARRVLELRDHLESLEWRTATERALLEDWRRREAIFREEMREKQQHKTEKMLSDAGYYELVQAEQAGILRI